MDLVEDTGVVGVSKEDPEDVVRWRPMICIDEEHPLVELNEPQV